MMLSGPIYSSNIHDKKFISRLIQLLSQFEEESNNNNNIEEEEKEQSPTRNNIFNPMDNFETFTRIQGTLQVKKKDKISHLSYIFQI